MMMKRLTWLMMLLEGGAGVAMVVVAVRAATRTALMETILAELIWIEVIVKILIELCGLMDCS